MVHHEYTISKIQTVGNSIGQTTDKLYAKAKVEGKLGDYRIDFTSESEYTTDLRLPLGNQTNQGKIRK